MPKPNIIISGSDVCRLQITEDNKILLYCEACHTKLGTANYLITAVNLWNAHLNGLPVIPGTRDGKDADLSDSGG